MEGVARIGPVYTPPDRRGRGYGSALVGAVSAAVRARGTRCILYTDLGNPTANSVYRRLGYRAVAEALRYRFDRPAGAARSCGDRQLGDGSAATNPAMSRIVAAYTSGMATRKMASPAWQVPFTVRLTALTPASTSRR